MGGVDLLRSLNMVGVAQLVRVSDCGSEGRRFESGLPPQKIKQPIGLLNFLSNPKDWYVIGAFHAPYGIAPWGVWHHASACISLHLRIDYMHGVAVIPSRLRRNTKNANFIVCYD